jgi:hypothetical protein
MGFLVRNMVGNEAMNSVNLILMAVTVLCMTLWIALLNRRGESKTAILRQHWRAQDQEQLVRQLGVINNALLRAARK